MVSISYSSIDYRLLQLKLSKDAEGCPRAIPQLSNLPPGLNRRLGTK